MPRLGSLSLPLRLRYRIEDRARADGRRGRRILYRDFGCTDCDHLGLPVHLMSHDGMEQMWDACLQIHGRMTLPLHPSLYFEQPQLQKNRTKRRECLQPKDTIYQRKIQQNIS